MCCFLCLSYETVPPSKYNFEVKALFLDTCKGRKHDVQSHFLTLQTFYIGLGWYCSGLEKSVLVAEIVVQCRLQLCGGADELIPGTEAMDQPRSTRFSPSKLSDLALSSIHSFDQLDGSHCVLVEIWVIWKITKCSLEFRDIQSFLEARTSKSRLLFK